MSTVFFLTWKNLKSRKGSFFLAVSALSLAIFLFVSIDRLKTSARESFSGVISKTDLVVGARSGSLELLLYSVFHLGRATNNISWESYERWKKDPRVEWTIPISLGDSYREFRVLATTTDLFKFYRHHGARALEFAEGREFNNIMDVVLGSDVAQLAHLSLDQEIKLSHGYSSDGVTFIKHDQYAFKVKGILKKTGTPLDRAVMVSLPAMDLIHRGWEDGAPPEKEELVEENETEDEPGEITSFLVGTKNRIDTLRLQREINTDEEEPLMAVVPGVALSELWNTLSYAELVLQIVAILVTVIGFLMMLTILLQTLKERRREMAILRSQGAGRSVILGLFVSESFLITLCAIILSFVAHGIAHVVLTPYLEKTLGLYFAFEIFSETSLLYLGANLIISLLIGAIPAFKAYRQSLADGLQVKV